MNAATQATLAAALLSLTFTPSTQASGNPLLGEIMWVGFNFCPRGWAEASGQLLPISSNSALFSLYGTTYGGDGRTSFALPDLRGRVALHDGRGASLSDYRRGQIGGSETKTLNTNEIPSHSHSANSINANIVANKQAGDKSDPDNRLLADGQRAALYTDPPALADQVNMHSNSVKVSGNTAATGGGQNFDIRQPYLVLKACVALQGIFPSRS